MKLVVLCLLSLIMRCDFQEGVWEGLLILFTTPKLSKVSVFPVRHLHVLLARVSYLCSFELFSPLKYLKSASFSDTALTVVTFPHTTLSPVDECLLKYGEETGPEDKDR